MRKGLKNFEVSYGNYLENLKQNKIKRIRFGIHGSGEVVEIVANEEFINLTIERINIQVNKDQLNELYHLITLLNDQLNKK